MKTTIGDRVVAQRLKVLAKDALFVVFVCACGVLALAVLDALNTNAPDDDDTVDEDRPTRSASSDPMVN